MEPVRSYVICCVQRTGSWLLAHTLADTGYAGRLSDYFDEAERETRTREWSLPPGQLTPYVRAMWGQRADKVRQGISWWRAAATGQWALRPDQRSGRPAPDVEQIVRLVQFAQQCEDGAQRVPSAGVGSQPSRGR